ncbi:hypothetical protein [Breoghania sp.]|uniref:ABC transporter permease subunit n=1 Tax=Breoghania sp. TaxID=2065378 RepID=UPI00262553D7|nr:hypothetical protein [Breoghania sp.]MDJ0933077.1 hypothetical protein [Breoghania sp.]
MVACLLAGMTGGAAFALILALLKAYRGAHEVVTTIMMNFVAIAVSEYTVAPTAPFIAADQPAAKDKVPEGTQLPIIWDGTRLHAGLLIALASVDIVTWILYRTPAGFRHRLMGANQGATRKRHSRGESDDHRSPLLRRPRRACRCSSGSGRMAAST